MQGCHSLRLKRPLWEEVGEHSEGELAEVAQVRRLPSHGQVGVASILQEHSLLNSLHTRTPRYWVGEGGGWTNKMVEVQRISMSCDSLTFSPGQQVQVYMCGSCLEHFVCDECRNVHLRGRRRGKGRKGRGGREGGEEGEEGRKERRGGRRRGKGGEEGREERRGGRREGEGGGRKETSMQT